MDKVNFKITNNLGYTFLVAYITYSYDCNYDCDYDCDLFFIGIKGIDTSISVNDMMQYIKKHINKVKFIVSDDGYNYDNKNNKWYMYNAGYGTINDADNFKQIVLDTINKGY